MPQLIGLVLLGAGVVAGYKAVRRALDLMSANTQTTADPATGEIAKDLGQLELDPATGVYRPRKA